MKQKYAPYYRPEEAELDAVRDKAVFIFDTNCLLEILRLSPELAEKTVYTISQYKDRIRIPSHSGLEYHKRLYEIPAQILSCIEAVDSKLNFEDLKSAFETKFKSNSGCNFPYDRLQNYIRRLEDVFDKIKKDITDLSAYFSDNFYSHSLQEQICQLLSGCMLPGFSPQEIEKIKAEGITRFEKEIPPGYKDYHKAMSTTAVKNNNKSQVLTSDNNCFGDLIIWKEILKYAKDAGKDIFFISNDQKEDWIAEVAGKKLGPRIELILEFKECVPDKIFHIYTLSRFLELFGKFESEELQSFPVVTSVIPDKMSSAKIVNLDEITHEKKSFFQY